MLPPPSLTVVQMLASEEAVAAAQQEVPHSVLKRKQQKQLAKETGTVEAKQAANDPAASAPKLHRSLWRKLLGKGPKCVCQKRSPVAATSSKPGDVQIPAEYVGCTVVIVAGKRVPFSRDMRERHARHAAAVPQVVDAARRHRRERIAPGQPKKYSNLFMHYVLLYLCAVRRDRQ
ncbi:hypothetical protein PR003_g30799 [Phytophthora rubi]|uniref:Uncharacterized protein n=1 Tax=Phytophthora rubi TaxID=129364 RepID=A0A6A4BGG0_9STRA|nr:hypothetical protein PR001_g29460 [Phytophthora rubi]KAE8965936.1 hypothetical protein PR002_g28525 [Phytophthora rubi]KAE9270497.1 hypothetical protein PR003_g30799 [Phytophthora rubi]